MSSAWFRYNPERELRGVDDKEPDDDAAPATTTTIEDRADYVLAEDDKLSTCSTLKTQQTIDSVDGIDVVGGPPPKNFTEWNSKWSGRIVKDKRFKRTIIALIIINSIFMGIGTFDFVTENEKTEECFDFIDNLFLTIFTGEIILQAIHHRVGMLTDGWLLFDSTIVILSWFLSSLMVFRAFRIVRTLRLATRIQPLKSVVNALLRAVPRMIAIAFLLSILFYIFAVLFTTLYKDLYREGLTSEDYFSRMDITAFTLFQIMTLDGWSEVTKEVMEADQWAWLPFVSFVTISSFVFLNLMIAVLCEAMSNIQHQKRDKYVEEINSTATTGPSEDVTRHVARLEEKMDELALKLDLLVRSHDTLDSQVVSME